MWTIQDKQRVEINPELYEVFKDGYVWKFKTKRGILSRKTKKEAMLSAKQALDCNF